MIEQSVWRDLSDQLTALFDDDFSIATVKPVAGGDINQSYCISDGNNRRLFVKLNPSAQADFFRCEAVGLDHIETTGAIACPVPLLFGNSHLYDFLAMPYHPIQSHGSDFLLGQQLASMHRHTQTDFGFDGDNYIGHTPQINTYEDCWATFFLDYRIRPQLTLAYQNGFTTPLKNQERIIVDASDKLLADHHPRPSLVHGYLSACIATIASLARR